MLLWRISCYQIPQLETRESSRSFVFVPQTSNATQSQVVQHSEIHAHYASSLPLGTAFRLIRILQLIEFRTIENNQHSTVCISKFLHSTGTSIQR